MEEIHGCHLTVYRLKRRLRLLDDCRSSARFQVRRQLYDLAADLVAHERELTNLVDELGELGLELLDPLRGVVGFPFQWSEKGESERKAYLLLKLSDDPGTEISRWRFEDEEHERAIPSDWRPIPEAAIDIRR